MKKLVIILLLLCPELCQAQEFPLIPGYPDLSWGMSPAQTQGIMQGYPQLGTMQSYQVPFAGFDPDTNPIEGRLFHTQERGFRYVQFSPMYEYPQPEDWSYDYQTIQTYMHEQYGDPYEEHSGISIWVTNHTIGRVFTYTDEGQQAGWNVRFDARHTGGTK